MMNEEGVEREVKIRGLEEEEEIELFQKLKIIEEESQITNPSFKKFELEESPTILVVGGYVRDLFFKNKIEADIDFIATYRVMKFFKKKLMEDDCCRIEYEHKIVGGKNIGIRLINLKYTINKKEFSLEFREIQETSLKSLKTNSKSRDFTFNGFYLNFKNWKIYPPFYEGSSSISSSLAYQDLINGKIRFINPNDKDVLNEADIVLRAVRFKFEFGFEYTDEVERYLKYKGREVILGERYNIKIVSKLRKILKSTFLPEILEEFLKLRLFSTIFVKSQFGEDYSVAIFKLKFYIKLEKFIFQKINPEFKNEILLWRGFFIMIIFSKFIDLEKSTNEEILEAIDKSKYLFHDNEKGVLKKLIHAINTGENEDKLAGGIFFSVKLIYKMITEISGFPIGKVIDEDEIEKTEVEMREMIQDLAFKKFEWVREEDMRLVFRDYAPFYKISFN